MTFWNTRVTLSGGAVELYQLKYFLELVKTEHVSAAADFLNISQSALSKNITALENELNLQLFDRTKNRLKLNHNGLIFAKYAEEALNTLTLGVNTARSISYETLGMIRIYCYAYAPIITSCANAYSSLNPLIDFDISQSNMLINQNQSEDLDFILYSSSNNYPIVNKEQFWVSQPLFQENMVLIASENCREFPSMIKKDAEFVDLAYFDNTPFVVMSQSDLFFSDITYSLCQKAGFIPRTFYQTDDFLTKISTIRHGLAVSLIPESCLSDARALCPDLRHYKLSEPGNSRTVYLMRHRKTLMTEAAMDFWNFVLDYYHLPEDSSVD